ncbi:MAG: hypothetical protein QM482_04125 [Sulfurospirillum sp.]
MDISVFLIAFLFFIPLYLIGIVSDSKPLTIFLAIIAVLIAMFFGGEKYMYFDVMAIGIAIFFAFLKIDR